MPHLAWNKAPADAKRRYFHLIRNTFRFASRKYWDEIGRDLRPLYTAPSETAARERFAEFDAKWGKQYPAIGKL
jgi:putative transposase